MLDTIREAIESPKYNIDLTGHNQASNRKLKYELAARPLYPNTKPVSYYLGDAILLDCLTSLLVNTKVPPRMITVRTDETRTSHTRPCLDILVIGTPNDTSF
jgi:hypothetical protein